MATKPKRDLTVEEQLARGPLDLPFLMLVLLLTGIGLIMVFSASYASAYYNEAVTHHDPTWYVKRQAIFAAAGVVVMYLTSKLNYQNFRWMSIFVLAAAFVLLILMKVRAATAKLPPATNHPRWMPAAKRMDAPMARIRIMPDMWGWRASRPRIASSTPI